MKKTNQVRQHQWAFTLVEMLVVISIIGVLAALIFPTFNIIRARSARSKARNELEQVKGWIESYNSKFGHYPPDNAQSPAFNRLYYELAGTFLATSNSTYYTLDGRANMTVATAQTTFGGGFVNVTKQGGGDDSGGATSKAILSNLRPDQYATTTDDVILLVSSMGWPANDGPLRVNFTKAMNPFRYVSSNPTNNPKSYDLWIDIKVGNKTNRVSNWIEGYQEVNPAYPEP